VPAGSNGLYFLPYLSGERTPHADPLARGAFIGLTLSHRRGDMVRSLLEGVTYSLRDCLDIVESLGVKTQQVRTTGGGAKSAFWRQLQADMFGKRVYAMASDEGPAYGVALLAAVGGGEFKDIVEATKATVRTTHESKPTAGNRKVYDHGLDIYRGLYQSLKDDFVRIAQQ